MTEKNPDLKNYRCYHLTNSEYQRMILGKFPKQLENKKWTKIKRVNSVDGIKIGKRINWRVSPFYMVTTKTKIIICKKNGTPKIAYYRVNSKSNLWKRRRLN